MTWTSLRSPRKVHGATSQKLQKPRLESSVAAIRSPTLCSDEVGLFVHGSGWLRCGVSVGHPSSAAVSEEDMYVSPWNSHISSHAHDGDDTQLGSTGVQECWSSFHRVKRRSYDVREGGKITGLSAVDQLTSKQDSWLVGCAPCIPSSSPSRS